MRIGALVLVALLLVGCEPTYWAFPQGRTLADFQRADAYCGSEPRCLTAAGFRQVSQQEYVAIQQRTLAAQRAAMQPIDIVAYDVGSGDLFIGKSQPVGGNRAQVTMEDPRSGNSCSGYAEATKLLPGIKGSLGMAELLCRDGRKLRAEFVYDTLTSGYGYGVDAGRRAYRFSFGAMNLDHEALRERFSQMIQGEDEQTKTRARDLSF